MRAETNSRRTLVPTSWVKNGGEAIQGDHVTGATDEGDEAAFEASRG